MTPETESEHAAACEIGRVLFPLIGREVYANAIDSDGVRLALLSGELERAHEIGWLEVTVLIVEIAGAQLRIPLADVDGFATGRSTSTEALFEASR